jgi:copper chaperone NosL
MKILMAAVAAIAIGCASSAAPVEVRLGEDACAQCRMTLVSTRTAAQIIAAGEQPVIFDDLGCLREFLDSHPQPPGARVVVVDHYSGEWIDAATAVFTKTTTATPMASGVIAHAGSASRDADPAARGGQIIEPSAILRSVQVAR